MTDTQTLPDPARPRVVVGVDGSPDSIAALRAGEWAAAARGGEVVAVAAYGVPMIVPRAPMVIPDLRDAATMLLKEAIDDAFAGRAVVPVHTVVRPGSPTDVLIDESEGAALLVVGSRGHGGFGGLLLGSVSMGCSMHAPCPVLVLHATEDLRTRRPAGARVVVGVGGSPDSTAVLRAAAAAAAEMDAELLAIGAWQDVSYSIDAYVDLRSDVARTALADLDTCISTAFPDGRPPRLHVALQERSAVAALVEASEDADLVVVGSVGRNALAGVLLGSIALPVVAHASCPVLVIPTAPVKARERRRAPDAFATVRA